MNIELAKTIPLTQILDKIGCTPAREKANEVWYLSPFRSEKNASLKVNTAKNIWYDFGIDIGGDPVNLVCEWLKCNNNDHTIHDAFRWLELMVHKPFYIQPVNAADDSKEEKRLIIRSVKKLQHAALTNYVESRGISTAIASRYYKEVRVYNSATKKTFFALGLQNEDGGFELRNQYIKASTSPKTITFIRGSKEKPDGVHIFEGGFDFLSVIAQRNGKKMEDDSIVLNSLSQLKHAAAYISKHGYKQVYTWMDNDNAGNKAAAAIKEFCKSEEGLFCCEMNEHYSGFKDVNESHMRKQGLPNLPR